jgi:hypothetical protein
MQGRLPMRLLNSKRFATQKKTVSCITPTAIDCHVTKGKAGDVRCAY